MTRAEWLKSEKATRLYWLLDKVEVDLDEFLGEEVEDMPVQEHQRLNGIMRRMSELRRSLRESGVER